MERKNGRRPLLTSDEDAIGNLLDAVKLGMSNQKACDYAGISIDAFYLWVRKGEDDKNFGKKDSIYIKFINDLKKARADFQIKNIANIVKASNSGSWQASAWLLERRCPEEFALKQNSLTPENRVVV